MREMRDSGVEWIGEIPKDWNCCKQKYRFTLINGRAFKDNEFEEDGTYRILRVGNLFSNPVWYSSSLELEPDKYCEKGDLIYAWSMSYGPYIWNEEKVIYHYHIWKTKLVSDMDKMFSYYYLQALTESIKSQTHETTMGFVTMGIMNNSYIAYPRNIKEQKKISDYLDAKCSKIDEIIEKQLSIIEKLKEYKLSYINEVTNVNDGIKCHLGFIGQMKNGLNFTDTSEGHKIKFLGVGDFKDNFFVDKEEMFSTIISEENVAEDYMLHSGDIVFVRSNGSKELVGRAVMVNGIEYPVTYSGFCIRFRNIRPDIIDSKFLLYYFRSLDFRKQLEKYSQGSNISNLNQDLLSSLQFTIPSKDYQKRRLDEMEIKCKEIDNAVIKFEGMNNKLQEYKKSLIYEVVTGKKEV